MKKKILFLSVFLIFVFGLVLFSLYQLRKAEREFGGAQGPQEKKEAVTEGPRELIPSRPEDYGMIVTDENNKPKTQEEWNSLISQKIQGLKSETPPEAWDKAMGKISEDRQKTEDKIKQIDESIAKCKEILEKDPGNELIKAKLERLMMLRSIGEELIQK